MSNNDEPQTKRQGLGIREKSALELFEHVAKSKDPEEQFLSSAEIQEYLKIGRNRAHEIIRALLQRELIRGHPLNGEKIHLYCLASLPPLRLSQEYVRKLFKGVGLTPEQVEMYSKNFEATIELARFFNDYEKDLRLSRN